MPPPYTHTYVLESQIHSLKYVYVVMPTQKTSEGSNNERMNR